MTDLAAETRLAGGGLSSLPRVNLMPPEIAEKAQLQKVQAGLVGAVVLSVAAMGVLYMSASSSVTDAQTQLDTATSQQATLQKKASEFANVTAIYSQAAAAQATLSTAMSQEVRYSRFLNDLSLSIPDNVWVNNVAFSQTAPPAAASAGGTAAAAAGAAANPAAGIGTVTFSGVAFEHNDVAAWLESFAKTKGYDTPYLQSSTKVVLGERNVVNWTSTVNLTPAALSGRYTTKAGG